MSNTRPAQISITVAGKEVAAPAPVLVVPPPGGEETKEVTEDDDKSVLPVAMTPPVHQN